MSLIDSITSNYEMMWKAFIQPKRQYYSEDQIMTEKRILLDGETIANRFSYTLMHDKIVLSCTIVVPLVSEKVEIYEEKMKKFEKLKNKNSNIYDQMAVQVLQEVSGSKNCIVYLHSHTGSKLEGKYLIDFLLEKGYSLCLFDFGGAGNSSGEYITLGWDEKEQVKTVVADLRSRLDYANIGLWGKSMGAATGIFLCSEIEKEFKDNIQNCKHRIDALVLDSPFDELRNVVFNIANEHSNIPGLILKGAMRIMKSTIQEKANIDIYKINPIEYIDNITIPALFVTGSDDYIVNYANFMKMYKKYKGNKKIYIVNGGHADIRTGDKIFRKEVIEFFGAEVKDKNAVAKVDYKIEGDEYRVFRKVNTSREMEDYGPSSLKPRSSMNVRDRKKRNFSMDNKSIFKSFDEAYDLNRNKRTSHGNATVSNFSAKKFSTEMMYGKNGGYLNGFNLSNSLLKNQFKTVNNFSTLLQKTLNDGSSRNLVMKKNPLNVNFQKDKRESSIQSYSNSKSGQIAGSLTVKNMEESCVATLKNQISLQQIQKNYMRDASRTLQNEAELKENVATLKKIPMPNNFDLKRSTTSPNSIRRQTMSANKAKNLAESSTIPKLKFHPPSKPQDEFKNFNSRILTRIEEEEERQSQLYGSLTNRYQRTRSSHQDSGSRKNIFPLHDSLYFDNKDQHHHKKSTSFRHVLTKNKLFGSATAKDCPNNYSVSYRDEGEFKTKKAYQTVRNTLIRMKEAGEFQAFAQSDSRVGSVHKKQRVPSVEQFNKDKQSQERTAQKRKGSSKKSGYFVDKRVKKLQEFHKAKEKNKEKFHKIFSDFIGFKNRGRKRNKNKGKKSKNPKEPKLEKEFKFFRQKPKFTFKNSQPFPKFQNRKYNFNTNGILKSKIGNNNSSRNLDLKPNLSQLPPSSKPGLLSSKFSSARQMARHKNSRSRAKVQSRNQSIAREPSLESQPRRSSLMASTRQQKRLKNTIDLNLDLFQKQFIQKSNQDTLRGESTDRVMVPSQNGAVVEIKKLNIGNNIYSSSTFEPQVPAVSTSRRFVPKEISEKKPGYSQSQNKLIMSNHFQNVYNNASIQNTAQIENFALRNKSKNYFNSSRVGDGNNQKGRDASNSTSRYKRANVNQNSAYFLDSFEQPDSRNQLITNHFSTNNRYYSGRVNEENNAKGKNYQLDHNFGTSVNKIIKSLKRVGMGGAHNSSKRLPPKASKRSFAEKKKNASKHKRGYKSNGGVFDSRYFPNETSVESSGRNMLKNSKSGYLGDLDYSSLRSIRGTLRGNNCNVYR